MALSKDDLAKYVEETFGYQWKENDALVVPEPVKLTSGNVASSFKRATVLYSDLSGSTSMVDGREWQFAAEIYKNFLYCAARIISDSDGTITAYDGDRIMGVFVGDQQANNATRCALKINFAAKQIIIPAMEKQYPLYGFKLQHVTGVDTSPIRVAKTGVRGDNDLVWIGRAANYAAKLTELSPTFSTRITKVVHDNLWDSRKYVTGTTTSIWEMVNWTPMNNMEIYRSNGWTSF